MFRRGKLTFLSTKDDRIKIINERINQTERHLMELCKNMQTCTRKIAKYRNAYDELAKGVKSYADDEEINESFATGLKSFTNAITILGDYMDINVRRLELKIVNELAHFEQLCKSTRDNLRLAVIARDKEVLRQRQMLELKSKFTANNTAADSELVKAKMEVQRTNKEIDEIIGKFEQRKLTDIKSILSDFVLISMKYHTKALEVLSANFYDVSNIDEKDDFLVFQQLMKSKMETTNTSRKTILKRGLRSQSMDSLEHAQLVNPLKRSGKLSRSTKNLSTGDADREKQSATTASENDDDEEDDEDDDDDEDASTAPDTEAQSADSGSASDDEVEKRKKPVGNVFGAKTKKLDKSAVKMTRSTIKHPFKAVAATHMLKHQKPDRASNARMTLSGAIKLKPRIKQPNYCTTALSGEGVSGTAGGRLVTVVESKQQHKSGGSNFVV